MLSTTYFEPNKSHLRGLRVWSLKNRRRSEREYGQLAVEVEGELPPFDEVYETVRDFYESLPWDSHHPWNTNRAPTVLGGQLFDSRLYDTLPHTVECVFFWNLQSALEVVEAYGQSPW